MSDGSEIIDDDFELWSMEEDEGERDECLFPGQCCMPGPHLPSECHTAEMIEAQGYEHLHGRRGDR